MRQQHPAGDVADGIDGRIGRLLFLVDLDEALLIEVHLGVLQAQVVALRHAADGHQHPVVILLLLLAVGVELDFDLLAAGGHLVYFGLEAHFPEILLGVGNNRPHQIRVGPGQDAVEGLDQHHLAAECGINAAQFHADVAAADDQQVLGNLLHFQRLGRGHHPRIAQVEVLGHRRLGADRDDGLVIVHELLALVGLHPQGPRTLEVAAPVQDLHAAHLGQLPTPPDRRLRMEFFQARSLSRSTLGGP